MRCAKAAQEIAATVKDDAYITKVLGILQTDGMFAFFLYLLSEDEDKANKIIDNSETLLIEYKLLPEKSYIRSNTLHKDLQPITQDLDKLFFAKDILETTLVYARYYAKAVNDKNPHDNGQPQEQNGAPQ
ncbi:MAG: hypothetical protein AAB071_02335 [Bacteroidota bacterium]